MIKKISAEYWIKKLLEVEKTLNNQDKVDIFLVFGKIKPAAMIEISYLKNYRFSKKKFTNEIRALKKILNSLGLRYKLHINYPKSKIEVTRYSFIARNKRTLKKIISADNSKNTRENRLKVGALLGYPITAVKAFANNKSIDSNALSKKNNELKFLNFRLSKDWRNEIKYLKKIAKEIKNLAPSLYKKILKK